MLFVTIVHFCGSSIMLFVTIVHFCGSSSHALILLLLSSIMLFVTTVHSCGSSITALIYYTCAFCQSILLSQFMFSLLLYALHFCLLCGKTAVLQFVHI